MTKIEINWGQLNGILQFNASLRICSQIMGISEDVIEKNIRTQFDMTFKEYKESKMAKVKIMLQQKAIEMALKGNTAMMIFTLKNLCGWADKQEIAQVDKTRIFELKYKLDDTDDK